MKNFYGILLCILMLSFWTKKSEVKMSIESEEIEESNLFTLRNLQGADGEEEPIVTTPSPPIEEGVRNYAKSSGGLSTGGIVGVAIAGSVVTIAALALAVLAKTTSMVGASAATAAGAAAAGGATGVASGAASAAGLQGEVLPEFQVRPIHYNSDTLGAVAITKV